MKCRVCGGTIGSMSSGCFCYLPISGSDSASNNEIGTGDLSHLASIVTINSPKLSGIKHDSEKPDMSLLSSIALTEVAKVMTFGKKKYTAHNWRGGFIWSRPLAAAARHLYAYIGGEDLDPETGLSHLAHAICCLMFVLEFSVTGAGQDDRYKAPK